MEVSKIRDHFRRPAGKIDDGNVSLCQPIDDAVDCFAGHDFFALRAGVHMTMDASKVAKLAHVDLENFRACATQLQTFACQSFGNAIHGIKKRESRANTSPRRRLWNMAA